MRKFSYLFAFKKHLKIILTSLIFLSFYSSCTKDDQSNSATIIEHPLEEKIPHYGFKHNIIERSRSYNELDIESYELDLLHQYLQDPQQFSHEKLEIEIGSPFPAFNVFTIDENRLIILDDNDNKLIEYNLNTKESISISEFGRGPGDFQFPREMIKHNDTVYILRQDMYVSSFDCSKTPCSHLEDLSLEFEPSSMAISDNHFAILGDPIENDIESSESENNLDPGKAVHLIDASGEPVVSFGSKYEVDSHNLLKQPFVLNGMVRYSSSANLYVLAYRPFPYIYLYNSDNFEIKSVFKIEDFVLGKRKYWPDERRLKTPEEDFSYINRIELFNQNLLWIELETKSNYRITENSILWDREFDYYITDISETESYYIGNYSYEAEEPGKKIFLIDRNIVIYDERDGYLYLTTKDILQN